MPEKERKIVAHNRRARHDYFIDETYEAGIELSGTEVKSIRQGKINLMDSYASVRQGEVFLQGVHISPYEQGNIFNRDPIRERRLLLHKRQINKLRVMTQQEGFSLIPLQVYLAHGLVKIELAVARGKKLYDKRHSIAERDARREIERTARERQRRD